MQKFTLPIQVRWADIDANRHLRHSVYYDYGASIRMALFNAKGLTTKKLEEFMIGPVLFREEAIFKREIIFEDNISLDLELVKATPDFRRWSIRHHFVKSDDTLAAIITIDAAWIDMVKRKLAIPNEFMQNIFEDFPRSPDFELITEKKV